MQGVSVDFVVVKSHKHSSVGVPVVPQHSCDGGREVGELKAGDRCLKTEFLRPFESKHTVPTFSFFYLNIFVWV